MVAFALPLAASSAGGAASAAGAGGGFLSSLGTLGNAAGGIGQFLGGLGSVFGGKKKGPSHADQLAFNNQIVRGTIANTVGAAKEAGIHPLAALGINPASGAGFQIGNDSTGPDIGSAIANMGQGIGRATAAYQSKEQRLMEQASATLSLENQQLQNDRLRSEIRLINQPATPPPIPNAFQDYRMPDGSLITGKSEGASQGFEDLFFTNLMMDLRYAFPALANSHNRRTGSELKSFAPALKEFFDKYLNLAGPSLKKGG